MIKRSILGKSILCALLFPGVTMVEASVYGYLKNETSLFTSGGQLIGEAETTYDRGTRADEWEPMKVENSARLFINGEVGEDSSWHADLNFVYDGKGINNDYKGHKSYTQHDWLRELYLDTSVGDWYIRLGKQQVVWGTADGIKLLDIINPTDWREFTQNTMAESRVPVWMLNMERDVGDSGNLQLVVAQAKENRIPGLNADGDTGHAFIMKGVDTITGEVNGFYNIIPRLTGVATSFTQGAVGNMFTPAGAADFNGDTLTDGLVPFSGMSVQMFAGSTWDMSTGVLAPNGQVGGGVDHVGNVPTFMDQSATSNGFTMLNFIAQQGLDGSGSANPYANLSRTKVMNENGDAWTMPDVMAGNVSTTVSWDVANPKSAFEYMPNASFVTFNNSSGNMWLGMNMFPDASPEELMAMGFHGAAQSRYVRDYPDSEEPNFGMRYRGYMDNGMNFSLNYFYGYDANPSVGLACYDSMTGEKLQHELRRPNAVGQVPNYSDAFAQVIKPNEVANHYDGTVGVAFNKEGQYYGAFNPMTGGLAAMGDATHSPNAIDMVFTETLERSHNIGASFDYTLDTAFAPVVLRGEFLYKRDERQPVIDKRLMGIGYLPDAMTSVEHDVFKYVIGADINVFTNLMVSAQFIQFMNLDFVDEKRTCWTGYEEGQGQSFDCSRYTADMATLHLSNGLNKAEENKEFYSLFLSKPFGESQEHRWNNILMYEENGGWWNRFDVEYSFSDTLIGTFEINQYWGDENTMFGQFEESSNVQLGIKYIFE